MQLCIFLQSSIDKMADQPAKIRIMQAPRGDWPQDELRSQQLEFGQQPETTGTMDGYIVRSQTFVNINLIFDLGRIQIG
jgi:hypothetical protein